MSERARNAVKKKKPTGPTTEKEVPEAIPIRDLKIAWGSDSTQWKIEHSNDEKQSYAEAVKVMWFEVKATYKGAKAGSKYKIGFNISLNRDAFGWDSSPIFLMAKVGNSGAYTWKRLHLNPKEVGTERFNFPNHFEIEIPSSTEDTTLLFGLYEIWAGRWKGGLCIHYAYATEV